MRRLFILALVMMLLSGGSVAACLAAINDAQARQCCAANCPHKPVHNPSHCCAVMTAQDAEVAPAAHSADTDAVAHFAMTVAPGPAMVVPAAASVIITAVHSPPHSHPPLQVRCSLQL